MMLDTRWWAIPLIAAMAVAVLSPTPVAHASVDMAVGMPIWVGGHKCSLGFFGTDSSLDRLAITAGHCSESVNDAVTNDQGDKLGEVVARMGDAANADGGLTGSRGYTVIYVYDDYSIEPFFADVGSISTGDYVTKVGWRSGKTSGKITDIKNNASHPDLEVMWSDMVQLPGDSGSAWYTSGPTLVGMGSSGDQEQRGGGAGSQAQPIASVIDLIRKNAGKWGSGFRVWTE